jgi:Holliday junction resolvasome RuvABC endonuclease subunit
MGIDPGPSETAWVIWETNGFRVQLHGKTPNQDLGSYFFALHHPDLVAIEMIQSFGMAVGAEVFETCVWIGRLMERAAAAHVADVRRVFRLAVKMHLCHNSRAKDGNIRQALIDRLGAPGTKKNQGPTYGIAGDVWSALAVAITAMETPAP